jgi:hypothetical protein
MVLRNWFGARGNKTVSERAPARRRKQAARGRFEGLESRNLLANYTWSDAANTFVIDLANDESLTVSESSGTVSFKLSGGTFAQSGGDAATGDGTDTIAIGAANLASSVTIRNANVTAGTNNVTFGAGTLSTASFDVSITDADAVGTIKFSGGFDVSVSSALALNAARNIEVGTGSTLSANGAGTISLEANRFATRNRGNFAAISLFQCDVVTNGTGNISLKGSGGFVGVQIGSGAVVESTATGPNAGTISIVGDGGDQRSFSDVGVGIGGELRSVDGNISVTGNGGSSDHGNPGVAIGSGTIRSTGSGADAAKISVFASGGSGFAGGRGLDFSSGSITSVVGDIEIVGHTGLANVNYGAWIQFDASIFSTGDGPTPTETGNITIETTGGLLLDGKISTPLGTVALDTTGFRANVEPRGAGVDITAASVLANGPLGISIDGRTADTNYQQLKVAGEVNLGNSKLTLLGNYTPKPGDVFTIVTADNIIGEFDGLGEGETVKFSGIELVAHYTQTTMTLTAMKDAGLVVLGAEAGAKPRVKVIDSRTGHVVASFLAYESSFRGGVRVAVADLDRDGSIEIITAPGVGRVATVKVFDTKGKELVDYRTTAYADFHGGVYVAAGDVNGDQRPDIITAPGSEMGANIKVFRNRADLPSSNPDPIANTPFRSFYAFGSSFTGGATVAAGDLTGDGKSEIIVGNGPGMGPRVRVFDLTKFTTERLAPNILEIRPFDAADRGGVFVAAGYVGDAALADLVIGNGLEGRGEVELYDASGNQFKAFHAYSIPTSEDDAPVHVAAKNIDSGAADEILTGQGSPGSKSRLRFFDAEGTMLDDILRSDVDFRFGFFVA